MYFLKNSGFFYEKKINVPSLGNLPILQTFFFLPFVSFFLNQRNKNGSGDTQNDEFRIFFFLHETSKGCTKLKESGEIAHICGKHNPRQLHHLQQFHQKDMMGKIGENVELAIYSEHYYHVPATCFCLFFFLIPNPSAPFTPLVELFLRGKEGKKVGGNHLQSGGINGMCITLLHFFFFFFFF